MPEKIGKFRVLLFCALVVVASTGSYLAGDARGSRTGFATGYSKGQLDLALEIQAVLNERINGQTKTYHHFKDIKDVTLYVVTIEGVRTIATWENQRENRPTSD